MVLAAEMVGVGAGYMAGRGILGGPRVTLREPKLEEVRRELASQFSEAKQAEILRSFDRAVRQAR
jgi:hypothetical protein